MRVLPPEEDTRSVISDCERSSDSEKDEVCRRRSRSLGDPSVIARSSRGVARMLATDSGEALPLAICDEAAESETSSSSSEAFEASDTEAPTPAATPGSVSIDPAAVLTERAEPPAPNPTSTWQTASDEVAPALELVPAVAEALPATALAEGVSGTPAPPPFPSQLLPPLLQRMFTVAHQRLQAIHLPRCFLWSDVRRHGTRWLCCK
jgi:hypothetical protein